MGKPLIRSTVLIFGVTLAALARPIQAADAKGEDVAKRAMAFLVGQQQADGSWQRSNREPPAITALVLRALVRDPNYGKDSEPAKKAIAYLLSVQRPDGGIYREGLANYNTAIAVSALAAVKDSALKGPIDKAVAYLKDNQFKGGAVDGAEKAFEGGWGYGGTRGRPDVSNAAIVVEALHDAGLAKDDPAFKAALGFVSRMQNHSETNDAPWASDDGGFIYSPGRNGDGESSAGEYQSPDGKRMLRSYGSMTYAGLKSMIYAGLTKDDPRVKAAWAWIAKNWTLDENPGMSASGAENAKSGIFYYYHTLGRALAAYGEPTITDAKGAAHDWRAELAAKLAAEQKPDGSFAGDRRWMEDNPVIATVLATLALQDAMGK